ncbi:MAG TPA: hypothetical protein VMH20_12365 [Verrucomicrobiae bacterium]|nr:hypothetical protein [Verrucomicrobiae bacterium]
MKRPYEVTMMGWLFIAVGVLAFAYHLTQVHSFRPFPIDLLEIFVVELLAVIAGLYILYGHNWARWLAVLWMAAHLIGNIFFFRQGILVHAVLLALIAYALFRPASSDYFRAPRHS